MEQAILEKLVKEGLSTYKIAEKLNCSQTNVRFWLKKFHLTTKKEKQTKEQRNTNNTESQRKRAIRRKLFFVQKLGGKCSFCGYCKNWAALDFHHTEPKNKQIKLDLTSLGHFSEEILTKEMLNCQLLCANCHREHHNPDKNL